MALTFWTTLCTAVLAAMGGVSAQDAVAPREFADVAQFKRLPLNEAALKLPMRLQGQVTVIQANGSFYMQDEVAGVYVTGLSRENCPQRGQRILVEGVTRLGTYTASVQAQRFTVLGEAPLPAPVKLTSLELTSTRRHGCWVEVSGIVRRSEALEDKQLLTLALGAERLAVEIHDGPHPELVSLAGARVRVRGAIGGLFNESLQWFGTILRAQSVEDFRIEQTAPAELEARPIASLLQFSFDEPTDALVKVCGMVTARHGDSVFLSDGTRGLRVVCHEAPAVEIGDEVEALGFPARGAFSPVLEDAWLRVGGPGTAPPAIAASAVEVLRGHHDGALVTLDGQLAGHVRREDVRVLNLRDGGTFFTAHLPPESTSAPALDDLREGSTLRLTGVCSITEARPSGARLRPASFRLLLRTPADIALLRAPPWWTVRRLAWALAGMLVVILTALAWGWMLRRRVDAQTALIADGVKRTAILEERTRLAREFHDTLEQELTGLALHLETAQATLPRAPEQAGPVLALLSLLARRCVDEAGHAVLDLRSGVLETADLPAALPAAASSAFRGTHTEAIFTLEGESRRLPPRIEHALLRVTQEAATNAARHARATRFEATLHMEDQRVSLRLADDGCGFDFAKPSAPGQFGLLGMKERIEKIGGHFQLDSLPGAGTRIEITVPLDFAA